MRELIVSLFPLGFERYIEVFGGGGWVLFHKEPDGHSEVYNDFNALLVNLYRQVRNNPEDLMKELEFSLNSRADFIEIREKIKNNAVEDDVKRASYFYQLIRYSYASGLTSYGGQPHDIRANFPLIEAAHRRLARVVIENKDFQNLLEVYDRKESFFYLDPPYYATESYYKNVGEGGFKTEDHTRLRDTLLKINGKFLLSYNDCDYIRELYDKPNIVMITHERLNNIKQRYDANSQFGELIIANYDVYERKNDEPVQMDLFQITQKMKESQQDENY